ncbi:aldo/keto reductase [Hydrogenophaga sp.]|uniref:aldo/keto reductase n=1 Tax=Hydrogenophaga sp. TaxID=1904254 RepID=UPI003F6FD9B2
MQYLPLGQTGLQVSRLCLGMMSFGSPTWRPWILDEEMARPIVRRAFELGFNFFETADMYSAGVSEELTGKFVREFGRREEVVIATKVFHPVQMDHNPARASTHQPPRRPNDRGLSRKRIFHAVDASLKRLGTDYIDLYQIHRLDPDTPMEETLEALHDIVKMGKVRYIGASSMWAWQFSKAQYLAQRHGWTRFVSMQNHYNLAYREEEREMIPLCRDLGVGLIPFSPLARGFLAGTRSRDDLQASPGDTSRAKTDDIAQQRFYRPEDFAVAQAASRVAQARGVSTAQVAYAWLLQRPGITAPIAGVSKAWQLEEAHAAMAVKLDAAEIEAIEAPYLPHPVLGHS